MGACDEEGSNNISGLSVQAISSGGSMGDSVKRLPVGYLLPKECRIQIKCGRISFPGHASTGEGLATKTNGGRLQPFFPR